LSGSVIVEDNVVMAGQAGLADHVKIGKGAILGAQAGIMSNVQSGDFVMGAPAVTHREALRIEASTRKLPEAMRTLRQLQRQVQELQTQVEALNASK
jgi:UDP-3-O-[3-hydroxymyristoyl] glucosamine N-acyltransferase